MPYLKFQVQMREVLQYLQVELYSVISYLQIPLVLPSEG
jgi:hypothetical protein